MAQSAITVDAAPPPAWTRVLSVLGLGLAVSLAGTDAGWAFPLVDSTIADQVPLGTDLAAPDAQDLQHQLQLANGLGAPVGGGWTFVPRIDAQEMLTDNVTQVHSPRVADLVTYLAPGFSLTGDMPRLTMSLQVAPTVVIYTQETSLNALTQQLNGIGNVTLIPDLAFVDVRALAGVQSAYGGIGGLGSIGAATAGASSLQPGLSGNSQGLTRDSEVQTTSLSVSPYLMRKFGDWGTGRLGYSMNMTQSDRLTGFASSPLPASGTNGQTMLSHEETGHFVTGDKLDQFQDTFDVDLIQSSYRTEAGSVVAATGETQPTTTTSSSTRELVTDKLTYAVSHELSVFVSGGHEDIVYGGAGERITGVSYTTNAQGLLSSPTYLYGPAATQGIHDLTWSLGGTWTPGEFTALTASYGHQNGFNSLSLSGHYAPTPRTVLTLSYGSTLGTQLENMASQLNQAVTINGILINGLNGGSLFGASNALPVQDGVFRTDTLAAGGTVTLDRDVININLTLTKQSSQNGSAVASSGDSKAITATWTREMRPDMTLTGAISYARQEQSVISTHTPGDGYSLVASLGWRWQLSDRVSVSLRYSLLERQSAVTAFDIFQNMLILGVSKTF